VTVRAEVDSSEGHALHTGKPVISTDINAETRFEYAEFIRKAGVKALVNVSIMGAANHPPYGILQVDSRTPRAFNDEDISFLRSYANLLGAAVERLRTSANAKRAETARSESEARYRAIVESATDYAIVTTDLDGRITGWNKGAERILGWDEQEVLGQTGDLIFTSEDRAAGKPEAERQRALEARRAIDERWHIKRNGVLFWGSGQMTLLRDGGLRGYLKILRDHTEQRAAEARLRESEERFRTLAEGIPQLVWRSRSSGERTWGSPQWTAYSGLSEEESLGFGWLEAVHPDDRSATLAAWAEAEAKGSFAAEYRVRNVADGTYRWFQSRATPVRDPAGQIVEWLGTATDIDDQIRAREGLTRGQEELEARVATRTADLAQALDALQAEVRERENAEEALRQSQKMEAVGRLTGGIAHGFNNMLQGVAGSLEIARRRLDQGRTNDVVRYLTTAGQAVDRAASLTRRLLAFARQQRLEPRPIDPDGLIAEMADLIRRTVSPGVRVELNLRDGAWGVLCDPNELESTLLNLCINARDAMPQGGHLTIGTDDTHLSLADFAGSEDGKPGDYVEISVTDSGKGMSPEILSRVFEPFFTTKPIGHGTGLGLSQVYGFVRQSGGLVRLNSTPGRGTSVCLYLPRHERPADAKPASEINQPGIGAGETVLLVDDEKSVREVAGEMLRDLGYRVMEADDGPAAVRVLDHLSQLDLLVTDVGLPAGMNGRQVAEVARARWPSLPVLFITGFAETALPSGVEVIGKPFKLSVLAKRVQAILAQVG